MIWRIVLASPQLDQVDEGARAGAVLERDLPGSMVRTGVLTLLHELIPTIIGSGRGFELTITLEPLSDSNQGAAATKGGPDKPS